MRRRKGKTENERISFRKDSRVIKCGEETKIGNKAKQDETDDILPQAHADGEQQSERIMHNFRDFNTLGRRSKTLICLFVFNLINFATKQTKD